MNEHAAIVARRGTAPAHAEIWRRTPQGAAIACMAADDHPWLLSFVCTALTAHAIHMLAAHLYARVSSQGTDAIQPVAKVFDIFILATRAARPRSS
jgi:hypothetical protein